MVNTFIQYFDDGSSQSAVQAVELLNEFGYDARVSSTTQSSELWVPTKFIVPGVTDPIATRVYTNHHQIMEVVAFLANMSRVELESILLRMKAPQPMSRLREFLSMSKYQIMKGQCVLYKPFMNDFLDFLTLKERADWPESRVQSELSKLGCPTGEYVTYPHHDHAGREPSRIVGNMCSHLPLVRPYVQDGQYVRLAYESEAV